MEGVVQHILKVQNSQNYVVTAVPVVKFGYRYEAARFEDYEAAFDVASEVQDRKKVEIEIEELVNG